MDTNEMWDAKCDYYDAWRRANSLGTIWSMYDLGVDGFSTSHPYLSDSFIVYRNHWGEDEEVKNKHYPVMGTTWGDVYRAADLAIRESGDDHHLFIEQFVVKNGNELHLITGS